MSLFKQPKPSSFDKIMKLIDRIWTPLAPKPPYKHVCYIGDPVLRTRAEAVDPKKIKSSEIQLIIKKMKKIIDKYELIGLAAPQIGCPLQIIVMDFPKKYLESYPNSIIESRQIEPFSLKIFINPELQVINKNVLLFRESCRSIQGFSGVVPRFQEVKLTGLNEHGEATEWSAKGWSARIIQHEMDHLKGQLFTDLIKIKTLEYDFWYYENLKPYNWRLRIKKFKPT